MPESTESLPCQSIQMLAVSPYIMMGASITAVNELPLCCYFTLEFFFVPLDMVSAGCSVQHTFDCWVPESHLSHALSLSDTHTSTQAQ